MKISTKLLLFSVLVFLPVVCCAQDNFDLLLNQINKIQRQFQDTVFELEMKLQDQQKDIDTLQTRCQNLEKGLKDTQFNTNIHDPNLMENQINDNRKQLLTLESRLYYAEDRLTKADETIRLQNLRLLKLESRSNKTKPSVKDTTH